MKIRVNYTETLSPETLIAFAAYHGLNPDEYTNLRKQIRATLAQVGTLGLAEQIHEGSKLLRR